jgi:DNA-directed RNA polymerase specialized sigma24 family protein
MSAPSALPPTQEEALRLHQRLLARDPTARADLATAYLVPLVVWLHETNPAVPVDLCEEAAGDALLALMRNPASYAPALQALEAYLRMSARGDLLNALRKERKHHQGRVALDSVELSPQAGKYLGRDDDPSLPLRLAEEVRAVTDSVPDSLRSKLSGPDLRALELILRRVRDPAAYAEVWGLLHLSTKEQSREVKKRKDRLKVMLKRAGRRP